MPALHSWHEAAVAADHSAAAVVGGDGFNGANAMVVRAGSHIADHLVVTEAPALPELQNPLTGFSLHVRLVQLVDLRVTQRRAPLRPEAPRTFRGVQDGLERGAGAGTARIECLAHIVTERELVGIACAPSVRHAVPVGLLHRDGDGGDAETEEEHEIGGRLCGGGSGDSSAGGVLLDRGARSVAGKLLLADAALADVEAHLRGGVCVSQQCTVLEWTVGHGTVSHSALGEACGCVDAGGDYIPLVVALGERKQTAGERGLDFEHLAALVTGDVLSDENLRLIVVAFACVLARTEIGLDDPGIEDVIASDGSGSGGRFWGSMGCQDQRRDGDVSLRDGTS